jgi:hypothetical protein
MAVSLITSQRTPHPSVLFRKDAVLSVGGYRNSDRLVEDISLWLRLAKVGNLVSIPENLLEYRLHKGSITGNNRHEMKINAHKIIQSIGISRVNSSDLINNFSSYISAYSSLSQSQARIFLALRDLHLLAQYGQISSADQRALKELLNSNILQFGRYRSILTLGTGSICRNFYRLGWR